MKTALLAIAAAAFVSITGLAQAQENDTLKKIQD